ncbi:MAG: serine/threonine protein kinase, partial [Jaaginema sp. PMC 1080.18]|nr:serine/threonine protein kinase [Jaaginema sp. PMC 1080.18]
MIGKLLDGRYKIVQTLSAGGFGQTYLAQDTRRPGNPLCVVKQLKLVNPNPEFLPTAQRLFNSEAEILEALGDHPQIPRLLAYFEEDRQFYLIQDYVEGHNLTQELVPNSPWSNSQIIKMLRQVLPILDFVHSQGAIHRDIKPDNILRRKADNQLVLVDFGAVKQVSTQMILSPNSSAIHTVAIGTPGYMASEQAKGQPRPGSDLYSLGVIAIQAATGINPTQFQYDPHTGEILWQHRTALDGELAAILAKMVKYHFRERYQGANQILADLDAAAIAPSLTQAPTVPPSIASPSTPPPASIPLSQQATFVVGGQHQPPATQRTQPLANTPTPAAKSISTPKKDRLPLIFFGGALLTIFAIAFGTSYAMRQFKFSDNPGGGNPKITDKGAGICTVAIEALNVRSGPGEDVVGVVTRDTSLILTGKQAEGWVEIQQPQSGWVYNASRYINCPTDIALEPEPTPSVSSPKPPPSQPQKNAAEIIAAARQKYNNGDLTGAIAQLRGINPSSQNYKEAQDLISGWRNSWSEADKQFKEAQAAFEAGKWDDVIAFGNSNLPDNNYWRTKFKELGDRARERKAAAQPKPEPSPEPSLAPSPP